MTIPESTSARIEFSDKLTARLETLIRKVQADVYLDVEKELNALQIDESGRIRYTPANMALIRRVELRVRQATAAGKKSLLSWIIEKALEVLGLNRLYFRLVKKSIPETVEARVERLVMLRLGYDTKRKEITAGGWLDSALDVGGISRSVAQDMARAIAGKMTLRAFRKQFRDAFIDLKGRGYVERYWKTVSFDLFQQVDREAQNQYAEILQLPVALYSGTAKETTRDFCLQRLRRYYTRDEIQSWDKLQWPGKFRVGHNSLVHCGGYNCRHHLSWVSQELIDVKGIEVNQYNDIQPII